MRKLFIILATLALAEMTLPAQEVRRDTIRASRITATRQYRAGTRMVKSSDVRMLVTPLGDGSAIKLIPVFLSTVPATSWVSPLPIRRTSFPTPSSWWAASPRRKAI